MADTDTLQVTFFNADNQEEVGSCALPFVPHVGSRITLDAYVELGFESVWRDDVVMHWSGIVTRVDWRLETVYRNEMRECPYVEVYVKPDKDTDTEAS